MAVSELMPEVAVDGAFLKDHVGLDSQLSNEILHLPTMLTLAGGID